MEENLYNRIGEADLNPTYKDGQVYQHTDVNNMLSILKLAINENYYDIQRLWNGERNVGNANKLDGATFSRYLNEELQANDNKVPSSQQVMSYINALFESFSPPIRGVDYWTEEDKLYIIDETANRIIDELKGEYDADTTYEKLNIVFYQGSTYFALRQTKGNLPTNTTYWQLLAKRGDSAYELYQKHGGTLPEDVWLDEFTNAENFYNKSEVDNKLSLRDLLLSQKTYYFNTVADMKVYDLNAGDYVITKGYYQANDGGGAEYTIREKTNEDVIDEMFILSISNNSLLAELIINNSVNTKQCGIVGNGIIDETVKLNTFFSTKTNYNKVVNNGVYKITNTVFIKGKWRRDSNTNSKITFENATIHYDGSENGISLVLFNMFKYSIDGLSITRNSKKNFVQMIGCWHLMAANWDIQNIEITHDATTISDKTYQTLSSEYISFINCYILGHVIINCSGPEYINCINFYNSIIYSNGYDYCIKLMGTNSKQEINFYNSDLSYCTKAVFYVDAVQIGGCTVNCIGSYFDSARKIFYNDDKKNVEFNNLFTMMPANSNNEITNITMQDFTKNMSIGGFNQFGYNLPISNVNYALNGDMSSTSVIDGDYGFLMGLSSAAWKKEFVDSNLSTSGKSRKITYLGEDTTTQGITVKAITAPRNNIYTCYARGKIIAGSCDTIQIGFGGKYTEIETSRIGSNEFVLVNSKEVNRNTGDSLNFDIEFKGNVTNGLSVEFYEVGVVDGKMYIPNIPIHKNAEIT